MVPFALSSDDLVTTSTDPNAVNAEAPENFVELFTDGACSGNPGPGGWGFLIRHPASGTMRCDSGAEPRTTNNRMELMGAIRGLESLERRCSVTLVTDSQYVAKGITEWMPNWKRNGWRRKERGQFKPVSNEDLWRRIDELVAAHDVRVEHVLGHRGHPENEAVDRLAVAAIKSLTAAGRLN